VLKIYKPACYGKKRYGYGVENKMPRKGWKSITVKDEIYEHFWSLWKKNEGEYRKQGITSFSGFVTMLLYKMIQEEESRSPQ